MATVEKRPLTADEQAEAARLMAAWLAYKDSNKGATQQWLGSAAELGSQGLVGQYLRGIIPLNLTALLKICRQIGTDPRTVSPRLMGVVSSMTTGGGKTASSFAAASGISAETLKDAVAHNPGSAPLREELNTSFRRKLAEFQTELARAEREGQLTEEKIDLLFGVLRFGSGEKSARHSSKKVLNESRPGQSRERTKRGQAG